MITLEKARQIALEYQKTGFKNKTEGLVNSGYTFQYARSIGQKLYDNIRVKEEIERLQAEKKGKIELNQQLVTDNMLKAAEISLKNNDMANFIRASENLGKHEGWYEADNMQKREDAELKELQRKDMEDYKAYKRRQMLTCA